MEKSLDYFNEIAADWDQVRTTFFSEKVRQVAYAQADIQKRKTAADIGTGTGFITEGLLQEGLNVIAVDQSENMLQHMA